jgi:signal transduction histidine kinase
LIEIFCFTSGLSYKSKLREKQHVESQRELITQLTANETLRKRMENIRNKMARDLHDDVGATLSTILLYSNAATRKTAPGTEVADIISRIGSSARQMIEEMNDIVWAINPKNDKMEKIVNRIRTSAFSALSSQDIVLHFEADESVTGEVVPMDKRQNCYLIFKEALNNLLKYAGCTEVTISLRKRGGFFEMRIQDNGKGFDLDAHREGNGLGNMEQRAREAGGMLGICSTPGKGTTVLLRIPVSQMLPADEPAALPSGYMDEQG